MKPTLNHVHMLMSNLLPGPNLLSDLKYHFSQYGISALNTWIKDINL